MRIFGMSFFTIALIFAAAYLGAKNPGWVSRLPF